MDDILDDIIKRLERLEKALGLEGDEDGYDEEYDIDFEDEVEHTKQ